MKTQQIHFYATREDIEPVISDIEEATALRYGLIGLHTTRSFPVYVSALDIPSLGSATSDSALSSETFLVVPREATIVIREVQQSAGGVRYAVDPLANPDSVLFLPGGSFGEDIILYGKVGTTGESREAVRIFRLFARCIKKHFARRATFYVGAHAWRSKEDGHRLTIAVQSPQEYDLA